MDIYHYHPVTGGLAGMGKADPDPLDQGNWLVPGHATTTPPPTISADQVLCSRAAPGH
ncbi:hypothetical protein [Oceanisphaera psychrotolerans]|uniref:hypothetical protein n=1 Tax=Oceanisphaera psychrotolerans TaxID=1414654 RepID=UPI0015876E2D|nr:hypothetical protein [Oceanisphaera psychrotolerans]